MFLHLVDDSPQIKHLIQRTNEMFPKEHLFYVLIKTGKPKVVQSSDNVIPFIPDSENINILLKDISNYKAVFVHNLEIKKSLIVLKAPKDLIFVWGIWGFDYYYVFPELSRNIFQPYTKTLNIILFKHSILFRNFIYAIHPVSRFVGIKSNNRIREKAAKRINFTFNNLANYSEVYKVIESDFNARFNGIYYSIEYISKGFNSSQKQLGNNIFIGNSASNSSNHFDIFLKLKNKVSINTKIIVPLSYGCLRYKRTINFIGKYIFKSQFLPLNKLLSLERYNEILSSCNVMIFNHNRAQAFGNIIIGAWAGHKIFLRKTNPIYKYFKSLGVTVFSIDEELVSENLTALEIELQNNNRQIIEVHYGEVKIRENYMEIINAINLIHNK
ncbi:MAG: TDP-N-acetylfucosamine:lipid II N-acetylfucosaminyltransferase [bacterium]